MDAVESIRIGMHCRVGRSRVLDSGKYLTSFLPRIVSGLTGQKTMRVHRAGSKREKVIFVVWL